MYKYTSEIVYKLDNMLDEYKKKALSRSNINDYSALYQKYKRQYRETGHYAYKNIYNFIKHNMIK